MLSPLNLWNTEIHHSLQEIHQTLHGPYPGNSHLDPENGAGSAVSAKALVSGRQHPWEGSRHKYNKPRKDVEKLWKPGDVQKDIIYIYISYIHTSWWCWKHCAASFLGFPWFPIHHTSPAQNVGTACMGDGCRMSQSTSTFDWGGSKMTSQFVSHVGWWFHHVSTRKKKPKAQGSSSHHPSGLNPSQLHRQWHPLPFFRGTAWQSHSGGPPACACALDMPPGPPKWCFV